MMVEAEATEHAWSLIEAGAPKPTEEVVASGLEAAKPAIRELCRAQEELARVAAKPAVEYPLFLDYTDDLYEAVARVARERISEALRIASKAEREEELDRIRDETVAALGEEYEGRE